MKAQRLRDCAADQDAIPRATARSSNSSEENAMINPVPDRRGSTVTTAAARALRATVDGVVLVPSDDAYPGECAGYNVAAPRRPAVVVGATGGADVTTAVRFGLEQGLPVGVMATGHGAPVSASGAVLVTTRRMNAVSVDPVARTARAEAGVRWQQVIEAGAPHR